MTSDEMTNEDFSGHDSDLRLMVKKLLETKKQFTSDRERRRAQTSDVCPLGGARLRRHKTQW